MAEIRFTYRGCPYVKRENAAGQFIDKNPVIDRVKTVMQDVGIFKNRKLAHEITGVHTSTFKGWFEGDTRSPRHETIMAVIGSVGYEETFTKKKDIDLEQQRRLGLEWLAKREQELARRPKRPRLVRVRKKRKAA